MLIAFISLALIFHIDDDPTSVFEKNLRILFAIGWPVLFTLMAFFYAINVYREMYRKRVTKLMAQHDTRDIKKCVDKLTVKELKLILWSIKIEAISADEGRVDLIQQRMANLLFEKDILGVKDGEKKE